jgi:hypothetical protein
MTSVGEVKAEEVREMFFVHPAGNRTGDLSLMRRGWYHKTIASALPLPFPIPPRKKADYFNLLLLSFFRHRFQPKTIESPSFLPSSYSHTSRYALAAAFAAADNFARPERKFFPQIYP